MDRVARIQAFVETIWHWYSQNKRTLPWRDLADGDHTVRAYKVMVSEIMLQQTQVSRVKIVFKDFLERFPHIQDLAQASNREVLLAWRGMGYNSRALRLRDGAKKIVAHSWLPACPVGRLVAKEVSNQEFVTSNFFPVTMQQLQSIPGIGPYTAAAIRNFAFNLPTPCIDTNIRRILHRTFVGPEHADGTWEKDDAYLLQLAEKILDVALASSTMEKDTANWHAALMDFGSLVQTKRNPDWEHCPLTAKGIMKTTPTSFTRRAMSYESSSQLIAHTSKLEPGRMVGTKYIPNRIFRGKVIEELRDASAGLSLETLGRRVCIDWSPRMHQSWLRGITEKLVQERMLQVAKGKYRLFEG